jgi:hypothetical protein
MDALRFPRSPVICWHLHTMDNVAGLRSSLPVEGQGDELAEDWPTFAVLRLRYIRAVLGQIRNKTHAAELLGIDRRTLNRILARERAGRVEHGKRR